jgi:primosomal replication protein N
MVNQIVLSGVVKKSKVLPSGYFVFQLENVSAYKKYGKVNENRMLVQCGWAIKEDQDPPMDGDFICVSGYLKQYKSKDGQYALSINCREIEFIGSFQNDTVPVNVTSNKNNQSEIPF